MVDEVSRHCVQDEEPETVLIEVHLPGELDAGRLRKAFLEALRRHPRVLMREAPGPWYRRRYEWELTDEPDVEAVSFPPPGPGSLQGARSRAMAVAPPLTASPPIRLEVVTAPGDTESGAGGGADGRAGVATSTALLLTVHHTALDGPACLRILATAAEIYGGRDNSAAAPPVRPSGAPWAGSPDTPSPWAPPPGWPAAPRTRTRVPAAATDCSRPSFRCRTAPRAPRTPSTTSSWSPPP